ncbi:MAG: IPTL-CTERM sorting domain-containing protein [Thermodesulfobacteriota bacterium]
MNRLLFVTILAVMFGISYSAISFAACNGTNVVICDTSPPNPDPIGVQQGSNPNDITVNMLPGSAIDTSGDPIADLTGIDTDTGRITITVDNATIAAHDYCIENATNNNGGQVTLMNAHLSSVDNNCISLNSNSAPYILNITDSVIETIDDTVLRTGNGDDILNVTNSTIRVSTAAGNDFAITTSSGNDTVNLENSLLLGGTSNQPVPTAIRLGDDDDILTIGNNVELRGLRPGDIEDFGIIDCDNGNDTIVFAMQVPTNDLDEITAQIESKNPADDSIIINRLLYVWQDCEELVPQLQPGFISPVPTLSQWGLIATAGLLGIIGFIVVRRRNLAS